MGNKWDRIQPWAFSVMGSLLAIAIIGDQPYLGIGLAVLAGLAVGLSSILAADQDESGEMDRRNDHE